VHQCTRFAHQSVGFGRCRTCSASDDGANSAQKGAVHDKQRWPDGQRSLRRFCAKTAGSALKATAERLRSRAQQGCCHDASDGLTCAERSAPTRGRKPLAAIGLSGLLNRTCCLRCALVLAGNRTDDEPHHSAVILSMCRSSARQQHHQCCNQSENPSSNSAHLGLVYTISISVR
jgi:hypothetical protein